MNESSGTITEFQPSHGSQIVRGTASAFIFNVLGYGCLFLGQILVVRLLSHAEYAEFTVSVSFVAIIALLADLGMTPLFTRLFAHAEEEVLAKSEDRRGILLGSALTLRITLSALVALLVLLIAPFLYPGRMVHVMAVLLIGLIISSRLVIVRSVGDSVLRGMGKYYLTAVFGLFDAVAFALLMVVAIYHHFGLSEVVWIYVLCNIPGFVMLTRSIVLWARREHVRLRANWDTARSMLKLSLPLVLGTAFITMYSQVDNILLYHLSSSFEVSNYGASIRLSTAMSAFAFVLAAVTAPEITRLLHRGDELRARYLTDIALRLLVVSGGAIALVVTGVADIIVPMILGSKYVSASSLFVWTGWMLVPVFISTLLMEISIAADHAWFTTASAGITMIAVVIGDFIFIPTYGAMGAMSSRLIAITLGAGLIVWLSRKSSHFDAPRFTRAVSRTALAASIAVGLFLSLASSFAGLVASTLIALLVYFIMIHFLHVLPLREVLSLGRRLSKSENKAPLKLYKTDEKETTLAKY